MVSNRDKLQRSKTGRTDTEVQSNKKININTAGIEDLMDISPQIGRDRAISIIRWRETLPGGKYERVDQLGEIVGFGPKLLTAFHRFATVDEVEEAEQPRVEAE